MCVRVSAHAGECPCLHTCIRGGQRSTLNVIPQVPSRVSHLAWNSLILLAFECLESRHQPATGSPALEQRSSNLLTFLCELWEPDSGTCAFSTIASQLSHIPDLGCPFFVQFNSCIEKRNHADRWPPGLRRCISAAPTLGHASKTQHPYCSPQWNPVTRLSQSGFHRMRGHMRATCSFFQKAQEL